MLTSHSVKTHNTKNNEQRLQFAGFVLDATEKGHSAFKKECTLKMFSIGPAGRGWGVWGKGGG